LRRLLALVGLSLALLRATSVPAAGEPSPAREVLVGTWACQSVYGGPFTGRACPTWPPLTLNADGTYVWGSERGAWSVEEGRLRLSARTATGTLDADGRLVVEYEVKGVAYRQTLFKR
jgi:hypothetical protein